MHLVLLWPPLLLVLAARVAKSDRPFCGRPPEIEYAYIDAEDDTDQPQNEYKVGSEVIYTCRFGYVITGRSQIIRCDQIGDEAKWREAEFSCSPQSCGDPGHIINGYRVGSLFTFPNNVTYHCDAGYTLRGIERKTRYCQTSGQWSGRLPVCEVVTCDSPKDVPNGYVTAPSYEYGVTLKYGCDSGYRLSSNEVVYCTEDGTWSKTDITCEEILCEMPKTPDFGDVTIRGDEESPRAGNIAVFSCQEGRIPSGPTTSKCLDIGKWTFPAPQCLEPCTVQFMNNGVIGHYVRTSRWTSNTVFRELKVRTRVEEDKDFYIRCYDGFEVPGSERKETKITCNKGRWSAPLECNPASCRSSPPYSPNSAIVEIDSKHEGTVSYDCFPDYRKTAEETVVCSYGHWNGVAPQCKPTKCSRDSLTSFGIWKGSKYFYHDREVLSYTCEYPRYQKPAGHNGEIICVDGSWTGDSPFCEAASCTDAPPSIAHGKVKNLTTLHGSIVKYVCEGPYRLISDSLVQCSFGRWTGQAPVCRDSRCYLRNLHYKFKVSSNTPTATSSGEKLNVICEEGYSANKKLPVCEMGVWKENTYESLCKESDCNVPRIPYGSLNEEIFGDSYFSFSSFRYERTLEYRMISEGSFVPSGKVLRLSCQQPYTFQGTSNQYYQIRCSKGKWSNDLVCLQIGQPYRPTTTVEPRLPILTAIPFVRTSPDSNSPTASTKMFSVTTISSSTAVRGIEEVTTRSAIIDPIQEIPKDPCSCIYPLHDSNLLAHVNGERLSLWDEVQNGATVVFRCLHIGYHRLIGRTEISCTDCQTWHSSDFPSCIEPKKGDVVIIPDKSVAVLEDGTLEISKGQNVSLSCIAVEAAEYPTWNFPEAEGISLHQDLKERKHLGDILYRKHINIQNVNYSHEGTYDCYIENNEKITLNITVTDPDLHCPEFTNDDDIIINYEKDKRENSKAYFSCPNKNQELVGEAVSKCLRTQEWSATLPYCTVRCKKLKDVDYLAVHYTNNQEIGSIAIFHCFPPGIRIGNFSAECLKSGLWSHPTPSCKDVRCKILNESNSLAIEYSGDRKVNSTVSFHCFQPSKRNGVSTTKCLQNGSWADPIPTCEASCQGHPPETERGKAMISGRTHGHTIWYKCYYSSDKKIPGNVTCHYGTWIGNPPQCVKPNTEQNSPANVPHLPSDVEENPLLQPSSFSSSHRNSKPQPPDQCICTYGGAGNYVQAKVGRKKLNYGDRVKKGEKVTLSCKGHRLLTWKNGLRILGNVNMTCSTCRRWGVTDNPDCVNRYPGDTFIILDETLEIQPGGVVAVLKKQPIVLMCLSTYNHPKWYLPSGHNAVINYDHQSNGYVVYHYSILHISETEYENDGLYTCYMDSSNFIRTIVDVRVKEHKCPLLAANQFVTYSNGNEIGSVATFSCPENTVLVGHSQILCQNNGTWSSPESYCRENKCRLFAGNQYVTYSNDNEVGSLATFSCPPNTLLVGSSQIVCQNNGTWSSLEPYCKDKATCAFFPLTSGLNIVYSNGNVLGSNASFSCSSEKVLNGNPFAVCLENGNWSHQIPSCEDKCSVGFITTFVEEGVVPDMRFVTDEFVPFGSIVPLTCEGQLVPDGNSTAVCGKQGRWKIGKFQCVSGCLRNIEPSSHLKVEPLKESYRFGETVILSCPDGEKMSNGVELLMCLGQLNWSDTFPDCIKF